MNAPRPVHPGEILREDFLEDYALTAGALAKAIGVPRDRMEKIIREKRAVTAETAARLAVYFNTSPQFWLNLQANFDLASVDSEALADIVPLPSVDFVTTSESVVGFQEEPSAPYVGYFKVETYPSSLVAAIIAGENPVRAFRTWRGLSAGELAKQADISAPYLSEIENGNKAGSLPVLKRIAVVLAVDLEEIID